MIYHIYRFLYISRSLYINNSWKSLYTITTYLLVAPITLGMNPSLWVYVKKRLHREIISPLFRLVKKDALSLIDHNFYFYFADALEKHH